MTLTDAELAAIRERVDAATRGKWKCLRTGPWIPDPSVVVLDVAVESVDDYQLIVSDCTHYQDARFIAHSRSDIPALLDTIAELRGVLAWYADSDNIDDFIGSHGDWEGGSADINYEDAEWVPDLGSRARAVLARMEVE